MAGNETGSALSRQQGKAEATSRVSPQGDSGGAPSRRGLAGGRIGKYRWHFRPREDEKILSTEATRGATLCSGPRWEREACHEALLNGGTFQKGLAPAQPDDQRWPSKVPRRHPPKVGLLLAKLRRKLQNKNMLSGI